MQGKERSKRKNNVSRKRGTLWRSLKHQETPDRRSSERYRGKPRERKKKTNRETNDTDPQAYPRPRASGNAIDARYRWLKLQWTETTIFDVAANGCNKFPIPRTETEGQTRRPKTKTRSRERKDVEEPVKIIGKIWRLRFHWSFHFNSRFVTKETIL